MRGNEMIGQVDLEDLPCPLGCPRDDSVVLTGRDIIHGLPGEFTIVKCRTCGLMRTNPRPTQETMGFYYPDCYGPYMDTRVQSAAPARRSRVAGLLGRAARRCLNFHTETLPPLAPGRLLEVGCASGAFLHRMAGQGWHVEGIEFSTKAARNAAQLGYRVHSGPMETAPRPDHPFDLIVGWMVLEHLHDPIASLRKMRDWTAPGGWLVLSLPNSASFEFRLLREKLFALHLPNHLYHFTPGTLEQVLRAGGWIMDRVYHQRVLSNLIASLGYLLRDRGLNGAGQRLIDFPTRGGRLPYALFPPAYLLSLFGQTGRMTVWARRSEKVP